MRGITAFPWAFGEDDKDEGLVGEGWLTIGASYAGYVAAAVEVGGYIVGKGW